MSLSLSLSHPPGLLLSSHKPVEQDQFTLRLNCFFLWAPKAHVPALGFQETNLFPRNDGLYWQHHVLLILQLVYQLLSLFSRSMRKMRGWFKCAYDIVCELVTPSD